jgi:hypothetical protein
MKNISAALEAHGSIGAHDVAAGVHETVLNAFSVAHHTNEHPKPANPYKGSGDIADLQLGYAYDIAKPAVFDLSPNPSFDDLMSRWLIAQPEILQFRSTEGVRKLLATPTPNVKLTVPDIALTFKLKSISKQIQVSFSLVVLCFVTTDNANQLRITPISAVVGDPQALQQAVINAAKAAGIPLGKHDATCFELWELVKYIINNALADRISQFITSIPLPSFINVFGSVSLGNVSVVVIEKFVVATAIVTVRMRQLLESHDAPPADMKQHATMMQGVADAVFREASHGASPMSMQTAIDAAALPGHGFFLLLTQTLFQKLANKYVNINDSSESCGTFLGIFQGCAGWAIRLWNPRVSLQPPNLLVDFDFLADAYAKARALLHCGWTPWGSIGVKGTANPARLVSTFYASGGNTIWTSAGPRPFLINWTPRGNFGWPLTAIIALLLDILTNVAVNIAALIGARWTIKLAEIPSNIPGTGVTASPTIDHAMTNYNGDLAVTGTVTFR